MPIARDWSSLPSELIGLVADTLLATGDVDCYVSLRAVCHNWRDATVRPSFPDPRFLPRRWVMLDTCARNVHDSRRLFLNVDTGRLAWKDLPAFRRCTYVATDNDGRLILHGPRAFEKISALNPFTGSSIRFPLYLPPAHAPRGRVVATGSSPTVALYTFPQDHHQHGAMINLNSKSVYEHFKAKPALDSFNSVVSCSGRVYAMDMKGTVVVLEDRRRITTVVAGDWREPWRPSFLVDNAGELLAVRAPATSQDIVQVFRVDLENKVRRMIKSIGNRAIFLGTRSMSVNADNLPAIEANCVYYSVGMFQLCMHRLEDGSHEELFEPDDIGTEIVLGNRQRQVRPLSLPRVLMDYATYESPCMHLIFE